MRAIFGVVALLLALLLFWQRPEHRRPSVLDVGLAAGEPTQRGQQVFANFYGETGQLGYTVASDRVSHYAEEKRSDFAHPTVTIFNEQGVAAWKVRANQARLVGNRFLHVIGAIKINNMLADSPWQSLRTEQAKVNLAEQLIELDDKVVIYGPHGVTRASRGLADLRRERVTLYDGVQTDYEVNY